MTISRPVTSPTSMHLPHLHCELVCESSNESLGQLYTGFGLLRRQGSIVADVRRSPSYSTGVAGRALLTVIVNGKLTLVYDTADGPEIDTARLTTADIYFKRSYSDDHVQLLDAPERVRPLGLNYPVYGRGDWGLLRAIWGLGSINNSKAFLGFVRRLVRSDSILSRVTKVNNGRYNCDSRALQAFPEVRNNPTAIFLARTWDPNRVTSRPHLVEERRYINEMRAQCIRLLRKELGPAFIGGFAPTPDAVESYSDCVVQDPKIMQKGNYLSLLRTVDVGIATMGLEKSNGWKLAEYVAHSKAIVSEWLRYKVPGDFEPGRNYLEFATAEECVEQVALLLGDPARRYEMMCANARYYHSWLRPDMLVLNSLLEALEQSPVKTVAEHTAHEARHSRSLTLRPESTRSSEK